MVLYGHGHGGPGTQGTAMSAAAWAEEQQAAEAKWRHNGAAAYSQLEAVFFQRRNAELQLEAAAAAQAAAQPQQHDAADGAGGRSAAAAAGHRHQRGADAGPSGVGVKLPSSSRAGALAAPAPAPAAAKPPASSAGAASTSTAAGGLPEHLLRFSDDLSSFCQYRQLSVLASLRYGDALSTSNMVTCAAFDRDDEFFATAGVSKRIKIFEVGLGLGLGSGSLPAAAVASHYQHECGTCWRPARMCGGVALRARCRCCCLCSSPGFWSCGPPPPPPA